jgi:2-polyprenyl-3-methyl-5-hydroxy-6-metoxy-1,4-benzoquinol methylase
MPSAIRKQDTGMVPEILTNKTMARSDLDTARARNVAAELNALISSLKDKDLKISSWYGSFELTGKKDSAEWINRGYNYEPMEEAADDRNFPWFLYWEIAWVTINAEFAKGQRVLDLGGSSSLFSYYLASKGLEVTTIDLQERLVKNANDVAKQTGWKLKNYVMDMRELDFDLRFDHITSICVYEHIPVYDRATVNTSIGKLLRPHGRFSITFDYRNPSRFARISTPHDVYQQFVKPSGLVVRGNRVFSDSGHSYLLHPFYYPVIPWKYRLSQVKRGHFRPWEIARVKKANDYTFGALFQEKTEE